MAPVVSVSPVVHGSGSSSCICRLWLQYWLCCLWFQSPVSVVVHGSSICCSCICCPWLQQNLLYLSFVAPVSVGRLWLHQYPSVVRRGSSLQYLLFVAPVAPVAVAFACGSSISRSWLQSPVYIDRLSHVSVVRGSSTILCCRLWLQYRLFAAPVAPVSVAPVAPLVVVCGSSIGFVVHGSSLLYMLLQSTVLALLFLAPESVVRALLHWLLLVAPWLRYHLLLSLFVAPVSCICRPMAPVSVVVRVSSLQYLSFACGSSICWRSWLQSPVFPVVRFSSSTTICCCLWWLQWLLLVAPVSSICCHHGSGISCRSWLQPVSVVRRSWHQYHLSSCSCGSGSGSSTIYCHFLWLQAVACGSCGCRCCLS